MQVRVHVRGRPHPDNVRNTKLEWLKRIKSHLSLPKTRQVWIWWDILSIPQHDRNLQLAAIASLCAYTQLCTRFIPLVRREDAWVTLYGSGEDSALPAGTLETCKAERTSVFRRSNRTHAQTQREVGAASRCWQR